MSAGTSNQNKAATWESSYVWDNVFGSSLGNSLLKDLCDLMHLIGGDPFPKELSRKFGSFNSGSFWTHVNPSTSNTGWIENEQELVKINVWNDAEFREFPKNWNVFDHTKLDLFLKIVSNISLLLRLRTHSVVESGFASSTTVASKQTATGVTNGNIQPSVTSLSLQCVDFNTIADVFLQCSGLSRKCVRASNQQLMGNKLPLGNQALVGNQQPSGNQQPTLSQIQNVQSTLLYISENLIATIHDLVMMGSTYKRDVLDDVLAEADIPDNARQFINELSRVMRHKFT